MSGKKLEQLYAIYLRARIQVKGGVNPFTTAETPLFELAAIALAYESELFNIGGFEREMNSNGFQE